jgi:hypothetical protein
MDVVRALCFGNQGQPCFIVPKPMPELIPKLFALGAMADLEVTAEQYAEAARNKQSPFDERDCLRRLMVQGAKAFQLPDDEEGLEQDLIELDDATSRYASSARVQLIGWNVFVTEKGYLGLGPQHLQAGDVVSLIPGVEVPIVLRPGENGRYQLVGEAYLHGIMDGEALTPDSRMDVIQLY